MATKQTGAEAALSLDRQIQLALKAMLAHGGEASSSQIYDEIERSLPVGTALSQQGRDSIRNIIGRSAVQRGLVEPHDPKRPGWRITPKGHTYFQSQEPPTLSLDQSKLDGLLALVNKRYPEWQGFTDSRLVKDELQYKRATVARAHELLAEDTLLNLLEKDDYDDFIARLDRVGKTGNLLHTRIPMRGDLRILYDSGLDKQALCEATYDLLYGAGDSPLRLGRFQDYAKAHALPPQWTFPLYFLFVCHPTTDILFKPEYLDWFLQFIDRPDLAGSRKPEVYSFVRQLSLELNDALQPYGSTDMVDIHSFIWAAFKAEPGYWKIAPGRDAWQWEESRDGGFIAIGWDTLGDVSGLTLKEVRARQDELLSLDPDFEPDKTDQVYKFSQIREGDYIVANDGTTKVLGIGTVTGPYYFVPDVRHGHRLPVRWDDLDPRQVSFPGWRKTLIKLNSAEFETIVRAPGRGPGPDPDVPSIWLFQADPHQFNLTDELKSKKVGDTDTWTVTAHWTRMRPDDIVLLWQSGKEAALHAIGKLTGVPYERTEVPTPEELEKQPYKKAKWWVAFEYTHILHTPIPRQTFVDHPHLGQNSIYRHAQGTNFRIPPADWVAIQSLIDEPPDLNHIYTSDQCAIDTGFSREVLEQWVRAIHRKRQAIFYGPPGTGKTFIADHIARHLIGGGDGFRDLIQFHPAYSYEDFIQGIRPQSNSDGTLSYSTVPGRFLSFINAAASRTGTCVLIIDEINRANIPRVFGELMYLLEYRTRDIPLAGGGMLNIPPNVRIIGTMNTADRSIALVDHALRRRFAFLELQPQYNVLKSRHAETGFPIERLISILNDLNDRIADRHYYIGISFFTGVDLADHIADIWQLEIEPYLEEFFFAQPDAVAEYRWPKVAARLAL